MRLEIHRAKLTARDDEIAFSLIYLKDLLEHRREARKRNIPRSSGSTFPQLLNATVRLLRGSHFAPHLVSV
jgi:hypothetical protein